MAATIVTFNTETTKPPTNNPLDLRRLAHRFLDAILTEGWDATTENSPEAGDKFEKVVSDQYRESKHRTMEREGRIVDQSRDDDAPHLGIRLNTSGDSSGFILRPEYFTVFDKGIHATKREGQTVAYEVERKSSQQWQSVGVFFGYSYASSDPDEWRYRQAIELNPTMNVFRCPLCGDVVTELFLTSDPGSWKEHFGCVPCTTALDPYQQKLYEHTRSGKRKRR